VYPIYPDRIVELETRHLRIREVRDHDRSYRQAERRNRPSRLRTMLASARNAMATRETPASMRPCCEES